MGSGWRASKCERPLCCTNLDFCALPSFSKGLNRSTGDLRKENPPSLRGGPSSDPTLPVVYGGPRGRPLPRRLSVRANLVDGGQSLHDGPSGRHVVPSVNQGVLSGDANVLHPPPYRRGLIDGAPAGQLEAAFGKHGDPPRGRGLGRFVHTGFRQVMGKCCVFPTGKFR